MAEFLSNASPEQLLMLMVLPVGGVLIFGGIILFSFWERRRKKSPMKLGTIAKQLPDQEASLPVSPPARVDLPARAPPQAEIVEKLANADLSDREPWPSSVPPIDLPASRPEIRQKANFSDIRDDMEVVSMDTPKKGFQEKDDLAGRPDHTSSPADQPAQSAELLRLLRDPETGQLVIEIAGRRYTKLADINDKEIGQYILELTAHLLAFTNGRIAVGGGVKSIYTPRVGETPMPLVAPTPVSQLPDPAVYTPPAEPISRSAPPASEDDFLASLRTQLSQPEPEPQQRGFFGRPRVAPGPTRLPPLNLAAQINEIVQARLARSHLATTTRLEVAAEPGGGIRIDVNGTSYSSPDEIPNAEVRELIKASIKEWEQK